MTQSFAPAAGRFDHARRPDALSVARELGVPVLDVVVPVYNEQAALAASVRRLHRYLRESFPPGAGLSARITVADNASTDDTLRIAHELAAELDGVRVVHLDRKGRGRALNAVWSASDSPVLAERSGLRIHEVPVDWVDDPDSRVDIVATATADLKGVARLLKGFATGAIPVRTIADQLGSARAAAPAGLTRQAVRFGAIGVASTLAYLGIFAALSGGLGAQWANLIALLVAAVANTAANRRFTFGVRGAAGRIRHHGEGLLVLGIALALTSGSLASLHALIDPTPGWLELGVLVVANLAATVLRFTLLRGWVFHPNR